VTEQITSAVVAWLSEPFSAMVVVELTNEWGGSTRFDVVSLQPNKHCVRIVEVKVSRPDFLRGIREHQLERYQGYCNQLFVAAPTGLINKTELPAPVGLLQIGKSGKACIAKQAASEELDAAQYKLMLERMMQKLVVEGSRWSQETSWKQQREVYARRQDFRDWLRAHENGGKLPWRRPRTAREGREA